MTKYYCKMYYHPIGSDGKLYTPLLSRCDDRNYIGFSEAFNCYFRETMLKEQIPINAISEVHVHRKDEDFLVPVKTPQMLNPDSECEREFNIVCTTNYKQTYWLKVKAPDVRKAFNVFASHCGIDYRKRSNLNRFIMLDIFEENWRQLW